MCEVSKFAGLQNYSRQLYQQMNSFSGIFWQHLKSPPMLSPFIDLTPPPPRHILERPPPFIDLPPPPQSNFEEAPPHVLNTCGKPWAGGRDGGGGDDMNLGASFTWRQEWKILLENEFSGNLNITNCTIYPNYSDICSFKRKLGKISGNG